MNVTNTGKIKTQVSNDGDFSCKARQQQLVHIDCTDNQMKLLIKVCKGCFGFID